jgi:predicted site-specific integrase-resolvase
MGQTTDCDEDMLLVREACAMLRMSPQTFRLYEKAGHIKVTKGPHRHSP